MPISTVTYLNAIRAKHNLTSDAGLARALGISRQTVSSYRQRGISMDDDIAARAAHLLGIRPATVLLDMYAERTRDPVISSIWREIGEAFLTIPQGAMQHRLAL